MNGKLIETEFNCDSGACDGVYETDQVGPDGKRKVGVRGTQLGSPEEHGFGENSKEKGEVVIIVDEDILLAATDVIRARIAQNNKPKTLAP